MNIPVITPIFELLSSTVGGYFTHKSAKVEAERDIELSTLKNTGTWESKAQDNMSSSWKDEYLLLILTLPLLLLFLSPVVDLIVLLWTGGAYVPGMLQQAANQALTSLELAPDWYTTTIFSIVGAVFGIKKLQGVFNTVKKT